MVPLSNTNITNVHATAVPNARVVDALRMLGMEQQSTFVF